MIDRTAAETIVESLKADPESVDFSAYETKVRNSEIEKDLYRQIHEITFVKKAGDVVTVVTVSDASHEECSMGGVKVFVVSQQLGDPKK